MRRPAFGHAKNDAPGTGVVPVLPRFRAMARNPGKRSDGFEQGPRAPTSPGRVAQLRQGTGLELADALTGEAEVLGDLLERTLPGPVEAEAQAAGSCAHARRAPTGSAHHLTRQQRGGCGLERRRVAPGRRPRSRRARRRRCRDAARRATPGRLREPCTSTTFSSGRPADAATLSAIVGVRPSSSLRAGRAPSSPRASVSPAWTGRRITRGELAMPRWSAWRIHQVA